MAAIAPRQPFAPLDGSRLSNLVSHKNRQNASQTLSPSTKRKAQAYDFGSSTDAENIDPSLFSPKRSKSSNSSPSEYIKPANCFLTRAPVQSTQHVSPTIKSRPILSARSPVRKMVVDTARPTASYSAPAGRSPMRKRIGIFSRRRMGRIDPPSFAFSTSHPSSTSSGLNFSIAAALSSTTPCSSYAPKSRATTPTPQMSIDEGAKAGVLPTLWSGGESKDSWFFDIHEDTREEEAHNLMEHGACTLDLSSDEETTRRERDEKGKENVPPADDVSQTRRETGSGGESASVEGSVQKSGSSAAQLARAAQGKRRALQEGEIEIDRCPLGDLAAEEFYAEGCEKGSVFVVIEDEPASATSTSDAQAGSYLPTPEDMPVMGVGEEVLVEQIVEGQVVEQERVEIDIDALMQKSSASALDAKLLQQLEKAEEGAGFEVWESGSEKGDE